MPAFRKLPLGHVIRQQPIFTVPAEPYVGIGLATADFDWLARGDFQLQGVLDEFRVRLVDLGLDQY